MGNNPSSDGTVASRAGRAFRGSQGTLGLSKSELDQCCKPSGLYSSCQWEERAIRRLVADGKLAARQKGSDTRSSMSDRECPICFLNYSQINVTQCCQASICTECYLQVRPQKEKSVCPFCNHPKMAIRVAKTMDAAAIQERQRDEQNVIEAKMRSCATSSFGTETSDEEDVSTPTSGFGSSLEKNTTVRLMRARSESLSSTDQEPDVDSLSSLAMTPEDRRALEAEMKAQHTHPLARQVEEEAEERRLENERNYIRTRSGRLREVGTAEMNRSNSGRMARMSNESMLFGGQRRSSRNWNQIVNAYERGGNGQVSSLDDLVVLEAAILLSMEEESRRRTLNSSEPNTHELDAAQHALNGFPMLQQLLDTDDDSNTHNSSMAEQLTGLARRLPSSHFGSYRSMHGFGASLRGITEAEQIEMAIALSLQQTQQQETAVKDEAVVSSEDISPPERLEATAEAAGGSTSGEGVEGATEFNDESCRDAEGEANGELVCKVAETTNDSSSDSEGDPDALRGSESSGGSCSCSGSETSAGSDGAVSVVTECINESDSHVDEKANTKQRENVEDDEAAADFAVKDVAEQVDDDVGVALPLSHDTALSSGENRDG